MVKDKVKREQVYMVLMKPVKYSTKRTSHEKAIIEMKEDVIYSTQLYNGMLDCDMTDFACGFYQIVYKDFLYNANIQSVVNVEKGLNDIEFAGDTMNSFNTVANLVKEAGKSKKLRTNENMWPLYLKEYKYTYHCLANFWLVPMPIGRTLDELSKAKRTKDYMDRFLKILQKDFQTYVKEFPKYFSAMDESLNEFMEIHFLKDSYIQNNQILKFSNGKPQDIISIIHQLNKERAMTIAKSDKVDELWSYFNKHGLIN